LAFNIINIDTVDSTNNYLKSLAREGAKHGTAVLARTQTAGRGRQGKSFYSSDGGVYFSAYYCFEDIKPGDFTLVTPVAALAALSAIEEVSGLELRVKWVNDIFHGNKKVCGILAERVAAGKSPGYDGFIVGVGVNLPGVNLPDTLKNKAGVVPAERQRLASRLAEKLDFDLDFLRHPDRVDEYRKKSCLTGRDVSFVRGGINFSGRVLDIDKKFRLIVKTPEGIMALDSGEVSIGLASF